MINKESLTVGELAKLANVSVRTLQYYDQIHLLKPSSLSEGGRRLYSSEDITILHQIITLKTLGLSLEDIKQRIIPVHDMNDVIHILTNQTDLIKNQMDQLNKLLGSIELLSDEIRTTNEVDWWKYSNMVKSIQENNEYYWVTKYLDHNLLNHLISHKQGDDDITLGWWKDLFEKGIALQNQGVNPRSSEGQKLAEHWWNVMKEYSKGDWNVLEKLFNFYKSADEWPEEYRKIQQGAQHFIEEAIMYYLSVNQIDIPTGEENDGDSFKNR